MKGLTSIELAILLAIIIVIAVAVGWYMYTTFLGATQAQAKLMIVSAQYSAHSGKLNITVSNPGPVNTVTISYVYLNNMPCTLKASVSGTTTTPVSTATVSVSAGPVTYEYSCTGISATPGTTLQGQVVISTGTAYPFTASVVT